jgi:hypothetical protein
VAPRERREEDGTPVTRRLTLTIPQLKLGVLASFSHSLFSRRDLPKAVLSPA